MKYLDGFSIPLKGLNLGIHKYNFEIDRAFFDQIENSVISDGVYSAKVENDVKGNMFVLNINLAGSYKAPCDRCLVDIFVPSMIDYTFFVKIRNNLSDLDDNNLDDEVIFVDDQENKLYLSGIFYQLILLSMPLTNVYDCENDENRKCDFEMLKKLESYNELTEDIINPMWNELKNIIKIKY